MYMMKSWIAIGPADPSGLPVLHGNGIFPREALIGEQERFIKRNSG